MSCSSMLKLSVLIGAAGAVSVYAIVKWLRKRNCGSVEVLFFPDYPQPNSTITSCVEYFSSGCPRALSCSFSHRESNLSRLVQVLASAKKSVDLCVYTVTSGPLVDVVLWLFKRGIRIRWITDMKELDVRNSQFGRLFKESVRIRCNRSDMYMHHKFFIVDDEILCTGSLNWSNQAWSGNWENVIIADRFQPLVRPFRDQFERLWQEFVHD